VTRRLLWVDASSGASGDMLLAALFDLGVPAAVMADAARAVAPVGIGFEHERRHGFRVARAHVVPDADDTVHRTWADIRALLDAAGLDPAVARPAHGVFQRLAVAEGAVHGIEPDRVHFHEVGGHDAVADVVGVCAGVAWLGAEVHVGPIALGGGTARSAHGEIPVPGPAVLQLLADAGAPAHGGPVDVELCTPTGAALLTELAAGYGPLPAVMIEAVGVGAGSRVLPDRLGALRTVLGTATAATPDAASATAPHVDAALVLETNVDDLDPRIWPHVLERLLDAGASDAWLTPILMKKGRPAHTLSVLVPAGPDAPPELRDRLERIVLTETTAIGLRAHEVAKTALPRTEATVDVGGRPVRVKLARTGDRVVNAMPEHDDVAAAARALSLPVKVVLARAGAAASAMLGPFEGE
jgi:pyridinium-3,5-bisthiocarboxylic acid mononucleotide nickel chelatase